MTNSSDFRRYAYSADASYALEAFNAHRTAAAPAYQPPRRQRKRELRVHENISCFLLFYEYLII